MSSAAGNAAAGFDTVFGFRPGDILDLSFVLAKQSGDHAAHVTMTVTGADTILGVNLDGGLHFDIARIVGVTGLSVVDMVANGTLLS